MSDYTVYDSEQELRENLNDVEELLADFDKKQQALDEQRGVLVDQVNGSLAIYEKQLHDYEAQRDELDGRQKELRDQRQPFEDARERLQLQVDAKREAKLDKQAVNRSGIGSGEKRPTVEPAKPTGPTTQEQIDQLKSQLSKPKPEPTLDPPGMGEDQASAIDKDLKLMAKIKAKEQKMDGASQKLQDNWNRSKGPKP